MFTKRYFPCAGARALHVPTRREFVYSHQWRAGDLVIWDNLATMHRATPFADTRHRRELRRVTTLDTPRPG